jgi:hypothetical protein
MFHVERLLSVPSNRRLVTDDEAAAYLKRVAEARERLRDLVTRSKDSGREVVPCDNL